VRLDGDGAVPGVVVSTRFRGAHTVLGVSTAGGVVAVEARPGQARVGDRVRLSLGAAGVVPLPAESPAS
jgi:hypothetical protein